MLPNLYLHATSREAELARPFHHGVSMMDATPAQLAFLEPELARFLAWGAREYDSMRNFGSWTFPVPKPGGKWRFIIDMRHLNS
eukprot:jgi/Tetstr1/434379/TSEL_023480.t1